MALPKEELNMTQLQCGFAQVDITPALPHSVFLDGYGHRVRPAEGVRDPIFAKVCVMQGGGKPFALVSMDVCGLNQWLKDRLCDMIGALTEFTYEQVALCATHTHAAPACGVLELPMNTLYWNGVGEQISQAILTAQSNMTEGEFRFDKREGFNLPFNRRGKENINRNVWTCGFYDTENNLKGVLVNASCHAVSHMDYTISADFPGELTRRGGEEYPDVPFLYLQSRGADINPPAAGDEGIEGVGGQLADLVFAALQDQKAGKAVRGEVAARFERVKIPMSYPDKEQLEASLAAFTQQLRPIMHDQDARRHTEGEVLWHAKALRLVNGGETNPTITVDLQILQIGGQAIFAFLPFEVLTVTGNALEERLCELGIAPENCLVIGYANGTYSYLCPEAEAEAGGYEAGGACHWYGLPEFSPKSEPAVINGIVTLAKEVLGEKNR